jgi:hypothetical protein
LIANFWPDFFRASAGVFLLAAGIGWVVLVVFLSILLFKASIILKDTSIMIDDVRKETVPLLHEVTGTVAGVNKEMDRVDGLLESAGKIAKNAERISSVVEQAVSSPIIKIIAFGAGASRAVKRLGKKKKDK